MSILIKGMEMPKNCFVCDVGVAISMHEAICPYCENLVRDNFDMRSGRRSDCPLVEVPTPHGRLIDADDVLTQKQDTTIETETSWELGKLYGWDSAVEYIGGFAPTVIEAEG